MTNSFYHTITPPKTPPPAKEADPQGLTREEAGGVA